MLMVTTARSGAPIDPEATTPDFQDFHQRLISGEVSLTTAEEKVQYARVHLAAAQRHVQTARFEDALALVASVAPRYESTTVFPEQSST